MDEINIVVYTNELELLNELKYLKTSVNMTEYEDNESYDVIESKIKCMTDCSLSQIPCINYDWGVAVKKYYFINLNDDYKYIKYRKIVSSGKGKDCNCLFAKFCLYDKDFKSDKTTLKLFDKFKYECDIGRSYKIPYLIVNNNNVSKSPPYDVFIRGVMWLSIVYAIMGFTQFAVRTAFAVRTMTT